MAGEDNKDDDSGQEDELFMVGDGVDGDESLSQQNEDDNKGSTEDDKDDEDLAAGDSRVGGGEPDDEGDDGKRAERKSRRQRQKDARDRDQRELRFLRGRNETLEKRFSGLEKRVNDSEAVSIDQRISQIDAAIDKADDTYAKAITASEGEQAAEAMKYRDQLRDQKTKLEAYRDAGTAEEEPEGPPAELLENVKDWSDRNKWFDFKRQDEDSAIAGAIDDMLVRDGWDPLTPEYYRELDARIARRLPHLAEDSGGGRRRGGSRRGNGADRDDDDDRGDGGADTDSRAGRGDGGGNKSRGPKFRVGGTDRHLKSNEVHISRERREAMEEAGVWDDPKTRARYLKNYAKWDKENLA